MRTLPPGQCMWRGPEGPEWGGPRPRVCLGSAPQRAPRRRRVSDGPVNWSCQVDKRDRRAHRRAPSPTAAPPPPAPGLPALRPPAPQLPAGRAQGGRSQGSRRPSPCPEVPPPRPQSCPCQLLRKPPIPPVVQKGKPEAGGPVGSERNRVSACLGRGWDSQVCWPAAGRWWRDGGGGPCD